MQTMFKGSISFGLVNIPIKMFAATEDKDVRFKYLHKTCNSPIKYHKKCPTCNQEIQQEDIVKGFEYEPGRFVILTDEDFDAVQSEVQGRVIDILDFVSLSEIDPIFFDKSYYLAPQEIGAGAKAYNLLQKAMLESGKIAIAKITIRNKQTLAALRVYDKVLVLETIFYPDEVRDTKLVPGLPENMEADPKELEIAQKLIDHLTQGFDPNKYKDDYREALKALIEKKIQGKEVKMAPDLPEKNVIDLMEALQASLKESKNKTIKATRKKGDQKTSVEDKLKKTR
ncbi:MAG: Ku protein [Firmicutes bacterium HGW-Firmicutes-1]|jgi:DNA end-binding protein Ku|nr:MAG: Ku protein [Firmicutes bacterium HGW-Firmicutes-1]